MCSVTVDRPCHRPFDPQTRSSRSSREKTRPGADARKARRSNSLRVMDDFDVADHDLAGALVDDELAVVECRRRRGEAASQHRSHAGFELGEGVGLRQHVVGAEVQERDPVAL